MKSIFLSPMRITQGFGPQATAPALRDYYAKFQLAGHEGLDLVPTAPTWGVHALLGGVVTVDNDDGAGRDYGVSVRIETELGNGQRLVVLYAHLSENCVSRGQFVRAGALIGVMGNTGNHVKGIHVHGGGQLFDARGQLLNRDNGQKGWIDLMPYLL